MKNRLRFLLILPLLLYAAVDSYADSFVIGDLMYTVINEEDRTVSVRAKEQGLTTLTDVVIPENVDNNGTTYTVISTSAPGEGLAFPAFYNCTALNSISFPETVNTLANHTFEGCSALTSIIGEGITTIGYNAIYGCTEITAIVLGVTTVQSGIFAGLNKIKSISLPKAESCNSSAFYNCSSLTSIYMPEVKSIAPGAFAGCSSIVSLSFPKLETVQSGMLYGCSSLEICDFPSVTNVPKGFFYGLNKLKHVSLNKAISIGVDGSGYGAFQNCTSLLSVDIAAATTIGDQTFYGCTSLETISLPSIVTIGNAAFCGCSSLRTCTLSPTVSLLNTQAFYNCTNLESVTCPTKTDITVMRSAFDNCSSLRTVDLAGSRLFLEGNDVFRGSLKIETANFIPIINISSVNNGTLKYLLGMNSYPSWLTKLGLGPKITSLDTNAFSGLTTIDYLAIGISTVTNNFCSNYFPNNTIKTVELMENVTTINTNAFSDVNTIDYLAVNASTVPKMNNAFAGNAIKTVELMEKVERITDGAFENISTVQEVVLGTEQVPYRVLSYFYNYGNDIKKVKGISSVKEISWNAFSRAKGLETADFSECTLLNVVSSGAFEYCQNLANVYLPSTITEIGAGAFYECNNIKNFNTNYNQGVLSIGRMPNLRKIGRYAFCSCSSLKYMDNGPSGNPNLTTIENSAFMNCGFSSLTIYFPLETIGDDAFRSFSLTNLTLPSTVREIGNQVWLSKTTVYLNSSTGYKASSGLVFFKQESGKERIAWCSKTDGLASLSSYSIPENVDRIDDDVFYGTTLNIINLPEGITHIGEHEFGKMPNLRHLTMPSTLNAITFYENLVYSGSYGAWSSTSRLSVCAENPVMAYADFSNVNHSDLRFKNGSHSYALDSPFAGGGYGIEDGERNSSANGLCGGVYAPTLIYLPKGYTGATALNVILTDDDGNRTCDELEFYDYNYESGTGLHQYDGERKYYAIPKAFTAKSARLKRSFTNAGGGKKFSVILPFMVDAHAYGTFYKFVKFDGTNAIFEAVTGEYTEPNVPYFFEPKEGETLTELVAPENVEVNVVGDGDDTPVEMSTADADGNRFIGVYEYQDIPDDCLNYKDDNFRYTRGAQVAPFRCYLKLNGSVASKEIAAVFDNGATGISELSSGTSWSGDEAVGDNWFTIDGRRLGSAPTHRGVYIRNGRKVVVQ